MTNQIFKKYDIVATVVCKTFCNLVQKMGYLKAKQDDMQENVLQELVRR